MSRVRWIVAGCAAVAVAAVAIGAALRGGGGSPKLSQSDWAAWRASEHDLLSRCTLHSTQTPADRQAESRDVDRLVSIAKLHPTSWVSDGLTRVPLTMTLLVGGVGDEIACQRPDLVTQAWTVARTLPGGYA